METEGFYLTYEAYERLTRARLGVKCDYCVSLDETENTSQYKFCPMCGRYRGGNIEEAKLLSHSEKYIVEHCIGFMDDVHRKLMAYMEMMDIEHTEGYPSLIYSNFEIVQGLLLSRTKYSGGTSTKDKCRQLGIDPYSEVVIGQEEDREKERK